MTIIDSEELTDMWTITLSNDIFPILNYSKTLENTFSGHIVETAFNIIIWGNTSLMSLFHVQRVNYEIYRSLMVKPWYNKKIDNIILTDNGNIQLKILN